MEQESRTIRPPQIGTKERVVSLVVQLGILGLAWWLLGLHWVLVAAFAGVIIVSTLVPERISGVVSGLGSLGLAALAYFYYGQVLVAALLAVLGVISLIGGLKRLKETTAHTE
jgi:hypothetical protein